MNDSFSYTTAISRGHASNRQTSFDYVYAPSRGEKFYVLEARGFAMRSESLYTPLHGEISF